MANFERKTYDNSYLFNSQMEKHHRVLMEFILKADRIDKNSDAFKGIIEAVKRQQTSAVLYNVLMRNDVVLCIHNPELSRAFKVFEAKDLKFKDGPKVFIDVTGLIKLNDGYFDCKKIDVFITYLFGALSYILYRQNPVKLVNNSNLSISGTECFVALFDYIIDYLRIIGFSANKSKISYLAGLYFLYHMMGKDLDNYTKNIAAKVAGLSANEIKAYDLYLTNYEEDFKDIHNFISMISELFKLKGLTEEVFISKWIYLFGTGTEFATELFTSLSVMITNAYCGSYVLNQKQIEKCCGSSMVKYAAALLKIGTDELDNRGFMEASEFEKTVSYTDRNSQLLAESFLKKKKPLPANLKGVEDDFTSVSKITSKLKAAIKFYKENNQENKISTYAFGLYYASIVYMGQYNDGKFNYEIGVMEAILKNSKDYLTEKNKNNIRKSLKQSEGALEANVKKFRDTDKEKANRLSKSLVEVRKCLKYV